MTKVLIVNKFYYLAGGAERYVFEWSEELIRRGHEVVPFSMQHEKNRSTPWDRFFIRNRNFDIRQSFIKKARAGIGTIWSLEAARNLERLLGEFQPDICHLHSFGFQITSSILPVLKRHKIPVVQTSHEYKLICPNQRLYDLEKGVVCMKCGGSRFYRAVAAKCLKDSRAASTIACLEGYFNRTLKLYDRYIDRVFSPSKFLADRLVECGWPPYKIMPIPNFVDPARFPADLPVEEPQAGVYFGRLSREKGLDTLLTAAKISGINVHLIGTGPLEDHLKKRAAEENIPAVFHGFVQMDRLMHLVSRCGFSTMPSDWYENGPFAALESMALARPLIVSAQGGLPEFVEDGVTGFTFKAGDAAALAEKMKWIADNPVLAAKMGQAARLSVEEKYSLDIHYRRVTAAYSEVLGYPFDQ